MKMLHATKIFRPCPKIPPRFASLTHSPSQMHSTHQPRDINKNTPIFHTTMTNSTNFHLPSHPSLLPLLPSLTSLLTLLFLALFSFSKAKYHTTYILGVASVLPQLYHWAALGQLDGLGWAGAQLAVLLFGWAWWGCGGRCRWRKEVEVERAYSALFSPLHLTRGQFAKILSSSHSHSSPGPNLLTLLPGQAYAVEKESRVTSLSLLLKGRLLVTQSCRPLHTIHPLQFVDSPEYFGVSTDALFQVTITAAEESRLLVWHRDRLRLEVGEGREGGFVRAVLEHVVGRDVVRKLVQVSDGQPAPALLRKGLDLEQPMPNKGGVVEPGAEVGGAVIQRVVLNLNGNLHQIEEEEGV